jgi:hypothetical protein
MFGSINTLSRSSTSTFLTAETLILEDDDDDNSSLENHCSHSSGSEGSEGSSPEVSEDDEPHGIAGFTQTSVMTQKMAFEASTVFLDYPV